MNVKGSDYEMGVKDVLMKWNGIPVLVTGKILVHPSNIPLIEQPRTQVDVKPEPE